MLCLPDSIGHIAVPIDQRRGYLFEMCSDFKENQRDNLLFSLLCVLPDRFLEHIPKRELAYGNCSCCQILTYLADL